MKYLLGFLLIIGGSVSAQSVGQFRYDTTKFHKVGGYNEVKILNRTMDTLGVFTNVGGGWGVWRRPKSIAGGIVIGNDTLYISGGGSGSGISTLGTGYGLVKINDSTYRVDSTVIASKQYVDAKDAVLDAQGVANAAAIQQRVDSLRNNAGTLEARKNGVFVPQFVLPTGGGTIDTTGKWLNDVDSVAPNTIRFTKGATTKTFAFISPAAVDTLPLSNRINANTTAIASKLDSGYRVVSYGKNPGRDSTILLLANGIRFAAKDSIGSGGGVATDTAFKLIQADNLFQTFTHTKGLKLANYGTTSSQYTPPLVFRGVQNNLPFWWRFFADGSSSAGTVKLNYSTDSLTWSTGYSYDRLGGMTAASAAYTGTVTAQQFGGTKFNTLATLGLMQLGFNSSLNPLAVLELKDSARAFLTSRVSNTRKKIIFTNIQAGTITNGGTGNTNVTSNQRFFTGGTGTGGAANFTVVGGVVTIVANPSNFFGQGYKVGDVLGASGLGGTGFSYTVTRITGDTAIGGQVYDSTLRCMSTWNGVKFDNEPTGGIYTASGTGAATTITIPHGLPAVSSASMVWVNPRNAASAGISYTTIDATNITIVYTVAPASGTNNLSYDIQIIKE